MASSECLDLQSRLAELKQLELQFERVLDAAASTGKFEAANALRVVIDGKVAEMRELLVPREIREIMKSETEKLSKFFGNPIDVPKPSPETMKLMKENRELWNKNGFELHYLPAMDMSALRGTLPNWKEPDLQYVTSMDEKLTGGWILIDGKQKPAYANGKQKYSNDQLLESILPNQSRFNLSWNKIQELKPEIARILNVKPETLSLPRVIDWNVLGNIHHPEWGTTNTLEWFEDLHTNGRYRLYGGNSDNGGLAYVRGHGPADAFGDLGFRPVVVFK